jgi:hypothetical protein
VGIIAIASFLSSPALYTDTSPDGCSAEKGCSTGEKEFEEQGCNDACPVLSRLVPALLQRYASAVPVSFLRYYSADTTPVGYS